MSLQNKVVPLPLSSINSAAFTGAYQLLSGASGITAPAIILNIINDSDKDIIVSYDGINDHDFVPTLTDRQLYFQTNSAPGSHAAMLPANTKIYVKGAAGTGLVYLSGFSIAK